MEIVSVVWHHISLIPRADVSQKVEQPIISKGLKFLISFNLCLVQLSITSFASSWFLLIPLQTCKVSKKASVSVGGCKLWTKYTGDEAQSAPKSHFKSLLTISLTRFKFSTSNKYKLKLSNSFYLEAKSTSDPSSLSSLSPLSAPEANGHTKWMIKSFPPPVSTSIAERSHLVVLTWAEVHVLQHDDQLLRVQDEVAHALEAGLRTPCTGAPCCYCHPAVRTNTMSMDKRWLTFESELSSQNSLRQSS